MSGPIVIPTGGRSPQRRDLSPPQVRRSSDGGAEIPPLRCAPVGMTTGGGAAEAGDDASCSNDAAVLPRCLLFLCLLATGCSATPRFFDDPTAPPGKGFVQQTFEHEGRARRYSVFVPHGDPPAGGYPVILFLHGLGEAGGDGVKPTAVGLGPAVARRRETFPFLVVFPQVGGDWKGRRPAQYALAVLDDTLADYPADEDRVSLTGISTGGYGVWNVAGRYPDRFVAAVPVAAYSAPSRAGPVGRAMPVWVWHYAVDPFVATVHSDIMARRLKDAGADVRYTKPFGLGHDVWKKTYGDALFDWLARQE